MIPEHENDKSPRADAAYRSARERNEKKKGKKEKIARRVIGRGRRRINTTGQPRQIPSR